MSHVSRFLVFTSVMLRILFVWSETKTTGYRDGLADRGRKAKNSCDYQEGYILGRKHFERHLRD